MPTRARLLVCLLAVAPLAAATVPTPESVLGFRPGADYKLATYDQSIAYFKRAAAASKFVKLLEAGKTTEGRTMYYALVSTPENLAKIDRYREIARRLAHPQGLTEADAHRLAREGKAFVHIDGGLHSTEVAGWSHTPQLLYDLISRTGDRDVKAILNNVVLFLWPTINPDGQQMVAEWYMKNVGTPYELSPLPRLYQDYVGHDNNRDAYMLNMIESRAIEHTWREWEPQLIYVHHQSGPFPTRIWLPPFSDPVGAHVPHLMSREVNMIGMAIAKGLDEHGQVGATHMGTAFDAWYPGYIDYAPMYKNIAAFWTETALFQYATPHTYTLDDFPPSMRDLRVQSLYASPWPPGTWRLRDAVDYMETASMSVLEWAAKYKESLLFDRYRSGADQIALGAKQPPYAYVVPKEQRDPVTAVELLRRLAFGGVRVYDTAYAWIVPMDQEFAAMAREVLDVQTYPDLRQYPGGPPERPYDAAGWSLPLQMDVRVERRTTPLTEAERRGMTLLGAMQDARVRPTPYESTGRDAAPFDSVPGTGFDVDPSAAAIVPPPGHIAGSGPILVVNPAQNNAYRAINRAWKAGAAVRRAGDRFEITGLDQDAQEDLVKSLALQAERRTGAAAQMDSGATVKPARVGLFQPWTGSMDTGWTRWILEQYGFTPIAIRPEDFKSPIGDRVDVLIVADDARVPVAGEAETGRGAFSTGSARARAVRSEYAYQLTPDDLRRFEEFIRRGGTLVCLSNASAFAIEQFKLPVTNAVANLRTDDFYLRGSIVEVIVNRAHPVMTGMPEKTAAFVDFSPVFDVGESFNGVVLAHYADSGSPLLSGYLIGENHLHGKAAAVDVPLGDGHVILIGFRPTWRGQPFGTFRVLFNAAMFTQER